MPRSLRRQHTTAAATVLEDAKTKFLQLKPAIDELKQKLDKRDQQYQAAIKQIAVLEAEKARNKEYIFPAST